MSSNQHFNFETEASMKRSSTKLPQDLAKMLEKMRKFEISVQNRCDTLDTLCSDFLNSPVFNRKDVNFSCTDKSSTDEEGSDCSELLTSSIFNDNVKFTSSGIFSDIISLSDFETMCSDFFNLSVDYENVDNSLSDIVIISMCDLVDEASEMKRNFWTEMKTGLLKFNARGKNMLLGLLTPKVVSGSAPNYYLD